MVPRIGPLDPMPSAETALVEPNGLVAVGGGLAVPRLIDAYRRGIFPWFDHGDPVLWWSPDPRLVLPTDAVHVSRSLARRLRRRDVTVTADTAFAAVVAACAAPRGGDRRTWITPSMRRAYEALHAQGAAHSLEVWLDGELAGGIYGVAIGRAYFGESMFSRAHRRLQDRDRLPGSAAGPLGRAVHRLPGLQRPPHLVGRPRVAATPIPRPDRRTGRSAGDSEPLAPRPRPARSGGGGRASGRRYWFVRAFLAANP